MTPRGPEPFPSASVHYGDRDRTPDPRQEEEGPQAHPIESPHHLDGMLGVRTYSVAALQKDCGAADFLYIGTDPPPSCDWFTEAEGRGPYGRSLERKHKPQASNVDRPWVLPGGR